MGLSVPGIQITGGAAFAVVLDNRRVHALLFAAYGRAMERPIRCPIHLNREGLVLLVPFNMTNHLLLVSNTHVFLPLVQSGKCGRTILSAAWKGHLWGNKGKKGNVMNIPVSFPANLMTSSCCEIMYLLCLLMLG